MEYTILSIGYGALFGTNASGYISTVISGTVDIPAREYPYVIKVIDDTISSLNNANTTSIKSSGKTTIMYHMPKTLRKRDITNNEFSNLGGIYLIYNPTDHSNNFGYKYIENESPVEVDFETLQKYAPWPIVEPVI